MIPDRLAAAAFEEPDAPFLVTDDEVVSLGEADDRVARIAGGLAERGVSAGDRVAIWGGIDVPTALTLLAVPRIGASAVPLNTRITADEARRQADEAGVRLWVGHDAPHEAVHVDDLDGLLVAGMNRPGWEEVCVVYTSGTTGTAKGVRLSRAALDANARASAEFLDHTAHDRWLAVLPLFHVGGLQVLVRSALVGGSVRLVDRFDVDRVASAVEECTLASLVSPMLRRLLDANVGPGLLRAVLLGGGPIPPGLAEEAVEAGWPVLPTYGQTEAASQVATCPPETPGLRAARPLPGVEVLIGDSPVSGDGPHGAKRSGRGEPGEILVRGPTLFVGYVGAPDRDRAEWHHTGDLGMLDDDGLLQVIGRADDVIVTGGENVHPGPVEQALVEAGATAAAVVDLPDPEWGSMVAAVVVGGEPDALEPAVRRMLPGFAVPRRWMVVDDLPRNEMGKTDRAAVRRLFDT